MTGHEDKNSDDDSAVTDADAKHAQNDTCEYIQSLYSRSVYAEATTAPAGFAGRPFPPCLVGRPAIPTPVP